jgi:hypothetical protein
MSTRPRRAQQRHDERERDQSSAARGHARQELHRGRRTPGADLREPIEGQLSLDLTPGTARAGLTAG